MTATSEKLAQFVEQASFDDLPDDVVHESKRILLDSIGCAIAAGDDLKGRIGIQYAQVLGGEDRTATILGSTIRSSVFGAAFANGELINALDFDAVLPPGHVSPYVLPGAVAIAESANAHGTDLILATALAHEISNRFGKAMDYIRDVDGETVTMPAVLGYTSTIFGATAAITKLRSATAEVTAHALGIAAGITPANSHRSWIEHIPISTIKYTMAGPVVQSALTAAHMALLGHTGDVQTFDDDEFGYPRFIGTKRWVPENITHEIGSTWHFPAENSFKHYPHCRALHGLLDLVNDTLRDNNIRPTEIDAIRAWGEGHVERASWLTTDINRAVDGQFSIAHGLAVGVQQLPPSKRWQSPEIVFDDQVLDLMTRISYERHPEWIPSMISDPAARPSRLEIDAHGQTYVSELRYPKGTPQASGGVGTTDDQLVAKFLLNAEGVLSPEAAEAAVDSIMNLERVSGVASVIRGLGAQECVAPLEYHTSSSS
ncbi:MmgE/PrpD family protein [Rhodococcus koreensis]|uniref:MmgE/PrpD family protein n=1 Tax=Rhodococcus koreensis TaxID=99653 RepID=UPI0019803D53|nr:MmgE/PrpD family protein [Rhodococcus koreensis]QSE86097.1 MmgE/PrpD family protein [Rhodococcus koreensis]